MANENSGGSNAAVVAIAVIALLAVILFLFFFRPGSEAPQEDGPDIELEVNPPGDGGSSGGDSGGN